MDKRRAAVWADIVMRTLIVVGALNWGLVGFFEFNLVEYISDKMPFEYLDTVVYCLVGISALFYFFARDFYLPFLGRAAFPCGSLTAKVPDNADTNVTVRVEPHTNVIYWAAEEGDVKKDPILAYGSYTNAGVAKADQNGDAVLRVRTPSAYRVPGKNLKPHVHYRTCDSDGMLGRVSTVYVPPPQKK